MFSNFHFNVGWTGSSDSISGHSNGNVNVCSEEGGNAFREQKQTQNNFNNSPLAIVLQTRMKAKVNKSVLLEDIVEPIAGDDAKVCLLVTFIEFTTV